MRKLKIEFTISSFLESSKFEDRGKYGVILELVDAHDDCWI